MREGYLLSRSATLAAMSGVLLGMLLAALNRTIVATALPAALNRTIVATALPAIVGDLGGMDH